MKVLHVDTGREMRGGQWQALHLVKSLTEQGVECTLLARAGTLLFAEAKMLGIEVATFTRTGLWDYSRSAAVVHAHDATAHTEAAIWSRAPVVVSRRVAFPIGRSLPSRWKYGRAVLYLAVSDAVRRELRDAGVPEGKIRIVHDAVPVPAEEGKKDGGVVALASDDPLKGEAIIRAAGVDVEFTSNLPEALVHAKVFVYVSESEGLGSAALAAMAHGIPVVASRVGGLPEVVKHEETGLLLERNDPELVRSAVQRLLVNEELAERLGRAGRKMVLQEFTVERMVERTLAAYQEVTRN